MRQLTFGPISLLGPKDGQALSDCIHFSTGVCNLPTGLSFGILGVEGMVPITPALDKREQEPTTVTAGDMTTFMCRVNDALVTSIPEEAHMFVDHFSAPVLRIETDEGFSVETLTRVGQLFREVVVVMPWECHTPTEKIKPRYGSAMTEKERRDEWLTHPEYRREYLLPATCAAALQSVAAYLMMNLHDLPTLLQGSFDFSSETAITKQVQGDFTQQLSRAIEAEAPSIVEHTSGAEPARLQKLAQTEWLRQAVLITRDATVAKERTQSEIEENDYLTPVDLIARSVAFAAQFLPTQKSYEDLVPHGGMGSPPAAAGRRSVSPQAGAMPAEAAATVGLGDARATLSVLGVETRDPYALVAHSNDTISRYVDFTQSPQWADDNKESAAAAVDGPPGASSSSASMAAAENSRRFLEQRIAMMPPEEQTKQRAMHARLIRDMQRDGDIVSRCMQVYDDDFAALMMLQQRNTLMFSNDSFTFNGPVKSASVGLQRPFPEEWTVEKLDDNSGVRVSLTFVIRLKRSGRDTTANDRTHIISIVTVFREDHCSHSVCIVAKALSQPSQDVLSVRNDAQIRWERDFWSRVVVRAIPDELNLHTVELNVATTWPYRGKPTTGAKGPTAAGAAGRVALTLQRKARDIEGRRLVIAACEPSEGFEILGKHHWYWIAQAITRTHHALGAVCSTVAVDTSTNPLLMAQQYAHGYTSKVVARTPVGRLDVEMRVVEERDPSGRRGINIVAEEYIIAVTPGM